MSIAHGERADAGERAGWQRQGSGFEAYERYAAPAWSLPLAPQLVELASPGPGERVRRRDSDD